MYFYKLATRIYAVVCVCSLTALLYARRRAVAFLYAFPYLRRHAYDVILESLALTIPIFLGLKQYLTVVCKYSPISMYL